MFVYIINRLFEFYFLLILEIIPRINKFNWLPIFSISTYAFVWQISIIY